MNITPCFPLHVPKEYRYLHSDTQETRCICSRCKDFVFWQTKERQVEHIHLKTIFKCKLMLSFLRPTERGISQTGDKIEDCHQFTRKCWSLVNFYKETIIKVASSIPVRIWSFSALSHLGTDTEYFGFWLFLQLVCDIWSLVGRNQWCPVGFVIFLIRKGLFLDQFHFSVLII